MKKLFVVCTIVGIFIILSSTVFATTTPQSLPFSQNWSDTTMITTNDDWSGVLGIMGFRGDTTLTTGTDPQTVLDTNVSETVQIFANASNPLSPGGGIYEMEDSLTVSIQGSGTADAPNIIIYLNTTGYANITVSYKLLELDTDNAVQQVALQYRIGNTGNFTNIATGYVSDASDGSGSLVTFVTQALPSGCDNQSEVDIRIITTNATGTDSMIGIDDINVVAGAVVPVELSDFSPE